MPTSRRHSAPPIYDHGEPIRRLSAAPLAGVLLVLAVLSALAYPLKTHALVVDLPAPTPEYLGPLTPNANLVVLTVGGDILWNGTSVTIADLRANLRAARDQSPQPSLLFEPQGDVAYGDALALLAVIAQEEAVDRCFRFNAISAWQHFERQEPVELLPYESKECHIPYGY